MQNLTHKCSLAIFPFHKSSEEYANTVLFAFHPYLGIWDSKL